MRTEIKKIKKRKEKGQAVFHNAHKLLPSRKEDGETVPSVETLLPPAQTLGAPGEKGHGNTWGINSEKPTSSPAQHLQDMSQSLAWWGEAALVLHSSPHTESLG